MAMVPEQMNGARGRIPLAACHIASPPSTHTGGESPQGGQREGRGHEPPVVHLDQRAARHEQYLSLSPRFAAVSTQQG